MKASETVMSKEEQARVWLKVEQGAGFLKKCDVTDVLTDPNLFGEEEQMHSRGIAETQAEITWQLAIKEVVEWLKDNNVSININDCLVIEGDTWQSKLEKWGVDKRKECPFVKSQRKKQSR